MVLPRRKREHDGHEYPPISFRPSADDRAWLLEYARVTGQPVNAVLRAALGAYRASARRPSRLEQLRAARAASARGRTAT
jgi:hypothetical protein